MPFPRGAPSAPSGRPSLPVHPRTGRKSASSGGPSGGRRITAGEGNVCLALDGRPAREIGDTLLAGFFGNGEVSSNRLYGYTGVLTAFA